MKDIVILGGPNGAGKTTAARVLLPEFYSQCSYLNADEMAREISPLDVESAAFSAGCRLIDRMRAFVREERGFALKQHARGSRIFRCLQSARRGIGESRSITFGYLRPRTQ
jgi:predicted ABC-type ATPase